VVSRAGAQGIAQFMPETAATVGLDNPFDPLQAIAASARLLRNLVKQFGNLGLAAAAYNAGPRRIQDWLARKGKLPEETQHYVKTITGRPAETWKAAKAASPVHNLPRQAPCREDAGLVASRPNPEKAPVARVTKREKGAKGATQLAAASKKGRHKVQLSLR
jgi:membrane-bound lytic murein transglycosylase B